MPLKIVPRGHYFSLGKSSSPPNSSRRNYKPYYAKEDGGTKAKLSSLSCVNSNACHRVNWATEVISTV